MKMKVTERPNYPELDIVAKTVDTLAGTIDRKKVSRCLVTEEVVAKDYQVVDGDGVKVVHANKTEGETELFVELVGGVKSLASFKFYGGWTAKNKENPEVSELFTEEGDKITRAADCAARMCKSHPECDGQWKLVDKDGNRWFLRLVNRALKANGRLRDGDDCED